MSLIESSERLNAILDQWKDANRRGLCPVEVLQKLSLLLEEEATNFMLLDPDPFDDQLQDRNSDSVLTFILKALYDNEEFMSKLCTSYMFNSQNDFDLNCSASRVLLLMHPVVSGDSIFQDVESQVGKLLDWVKDGKEPLRSYACGLLMKAMQMPDCPGIFKDRNTVIVPLVIKRLKALSEIHDLNTPCVEDFQNIDKSLLRHVIKATKRKERKESVELVNTVNKTPGSAGRKRKHIAMSSAKRTCEYCKPHVSFQKLTVGMQQKLLLKYLYPLGEYQELLPFAFEYKVLDLMFHYVNPKVQPDASLACTALMYLSSLLCHKKFIAEFVSRGGVQKLLEIPQPSAVATLSSLCFYYMAFSEDSMERVCLLPQATLSHFVDYLLWLLECSHISGRCHSSLFFSMTFAFRSILSLFDSMDGLRKLINTISTLKILRSEEAILRKDDDVFLDREMVKNATLTISKYYEAHVLYLADECKRVHARQIGSPLPTPIPAYKSILSASSGSLEDKIFYIKSISRSIGMSEKLSFKKSKSLHIASLLFKVIGLTKDWKNYNNRSDVVITAFQALSVLTLSKKILFTFCDQVEVGPNETQSGIEIILRAVEGDLIQDIQVQKTALHLLCNSVTTEPLSKKEEVILKDYDKPVVLETLYGRLSKSLQERLQEYHVVKKIWSSIRLNNGIKILLSLLNIKTPITEADEVRALVCKALYGLSGDQYICQVLSKLPTFHNEQIHLLMREPILSERIKEHESFCKYAGLLLEKVTGKSIKMDDDSIPTISQISKANIISQTKITYPHKELLQIIHSHLKDQGLTKAALALQEEANLIIEKDTKQTKRYKCDTNHNMNGDTPRKDSRKSLVNSFVTAATPPVEKKVHNSSLTLRINTTPSSTILGMENIKADTNIVKNQVSHERNKHNIPSLDSIVTSYLREQHAKCLNPVAVCPPFSLQRPHKCPNPQYREYASQNITERLVKRQIRPRYGGLKGRKQDRKYIYSRFRSTGCIKVSDEDCIFTSCAWLPDSDSICLGTQSGDVKIIKFYGQEEIVHSCHGAAIISCAISTNGKLLATSASLGTPLGAVWGLTRDDDQPISFDLKMELPDDYFVQFNHSEDRVIGTEDTIAHIYDLTSGQLVRTFADEKNANNYSKNIASFGPRDELILNDGCLWDVRRRHMIHKFDKFNDYISGVFHPSGLEVIINSEVWDIRTFHLLDTCSALDQSRIVFSNSGDVMFGAKIKSNSHDIAIEHTGMLGPFESSFRTFDAFDYTPIGTMDVKKTIFDISPNRDDEVLAVVENSGNMSTLDLDTTCRFYDIGRIKRSGEDDSDEEQEDESEDQMSGSNQGNDENMTMAQLFNNFLANDEGSDEDGEDDEDDDMTVDFDADNDTIDDDNDTNSWETTSSLDDDDDDYISD